MKYAPGSFSKNFAWHGTGLLKLHAAIRSGFGSSLSPIGREQWRTKSEPVIVERALQLVPLNFFLHNTIVADENRASVDELVFQAITKTHSLLFDRLALFAFHLNRAGARTGQAGTARPAMWANEFVREELWEAGEWRREKLAIPALDAFIKGRMQAQPDVRQKCRSNYRHLFELCEFMHSTLPTINTGAEQWAVSGLFLAWDRHLLDKGAAPPVRSQLLKVVNDDDLHKLMGVSVEFVQSIASAACDAYIARGGLGRFSVTVGVQPTTPTPTTTPPIGIVLPAGAANPPSGPSPTTPAPSTPVLPEELGGAWFDQADADALVGRRRREIDMQVRDAKQAAALKKHYDNRCMVCASRLQVGRSPDTFYAEAAHIKPVGKPHNGPDSHVNMLVLCPNHHLQFDRGILRLRKDGATFRVASKITGDPLHGKAIALRPPHSLDAAHVAWHFQWSEDDRN